MRAALGERGAFWIAVGIAVSTLGFLSQGILTAPRVYYAMARDGLFFKSVGWLSPKTGAPVVAIVVQGIAATIIAFSGRYEQILNYVVSVDFISFALTAASLFVFRRRDKSGAALDPKLAVTASRAILTPPRFSFWPAPPSSPARSSRIPRTASSASSFSPLEFPYICIGAASHAQQTTTSQ